MKRAQWTPAELQAWAVIESQSGYSDRTPIGVLGAKRGLMILANFTFSSIDQNADETTPYVSKVAARKGPGVLLSAFGYNSGAQQFLFFFDHDDAAKLTGSITDTDNATGVITDAGHGLKTGQFITFAGITGLTTGYVSVIDADTFKVYDTKYNAAQGGVTGLRTPTSNDDTGTWALMPIHLAVLGQADNFSTIVPVSGINFSHGMIIALSTTATSYTAGANEMSLCGTLAL